MKISVNVANSLTTAAGRRHQLNKRSTEWVREKISIMKHIPNQNESLTKPTGTKGGGGGREKQTLF